MASEELNRTIEDLTQTIPERSGKRLLRLVQWAGLGLFLTGLAIFNLAITIGQFELSRSEIEATVANEVHQKAIIDESSSLVNRSYHSIFTFISDLSSSIDRAAAAVESEEPIYPYNRQVYRLNLAKAASRGIIADHTLLYFWISIGLACLGALVYMIPKWKLRLPGIDHDGIYHDSMTNLGWLGIATGFYLIGFYVALYWYPEYLANWIKLVDPVSMALKGEPASQWFLYGFLYTLAILVMGVRMFAKYRHSTYHKVRTASVMFFQTAFAFLIPEILVAFNKPYYDFKNIWPLDYDFFFDWQLNTFLNSGSLGMFMLIWGTLLTIVGVPLMTYFYGKRWYCSWVCGCGGLAETLGDPYRQLSDNSLNAWKFERWSIHSVLVFVSVMTVLVLYHFFTGTSYIGVNIWVIGLLLWMAIGAAWYFREKLYESVSKHQFWKVAGTIGGVLTLGIVAYALISGSSTISVDSYGIRQTYGFTIGSVVAGVIGVGFYPTLGSRPWCRFGCPLAAYLGLIQRFKSRFRITTNGGQCISCGNCSTYCEMGIDVRWYAQRGQNIVRSSCVGCGVCSSVCPRGVLRLENGPEEGRFNEPQAFIINDDGVKVNFQD